MKAPELSLLTPGSLADEATSLERTLGRGIVGLALFFIATWGVTLVVPSVAGPHGLLLTLLAGLWLLPVGLLLISAARATRRRSTYRWVFQVLPLLYVLSWIGLADRVFRR